MKQHDGLPIASPGASVLLVEDEPIVRMDLAEQFREVGLMVIEAGSGDEALELLDSGLHFDVLFTDIRMPGDVDGLALAAEVRSRRPGVPVVIASASVTDGAALAHGIAFPKPFDPRTAVRLVEDLLQSAARRPQRCREVGSGG